MPRQADGTFRRSNGENEGLDTWEQDRLGNVGIVADRHDFHDQDLANGIEDSLDVNGRNSMRSNIDMGGFRVINSAGADNGDGLTSLAQVQDLIANAPSLGQDVVRSSPWVSFEPNLYASNAGSALVNQTNFSSHFKKLVNDTTVQVVYDLRVSLANEETPRIYMRLPTLATPRSFYHGFAGTLDVSGIGLGNTPGDLGSSSFLLSNQLWVRQVTQAQAPNIPQDDTYCEISSYSTVEPFNSGVAGSSNFYRSRQRNFSPSVLFLRGSFFYEFG